MPTRSQRYEDIPTSYSENTVDIDYKAEWEKLNCRMKEMELRHEEELNRNDSEWMRKMAELDERRVRELNEVKKELNYNKNIVKSVLHIRED